MEKTKSVPFNGTQKQEAMLHAVIDELREDKGCLMPIMQKAQEIYGYLPYEVQKMISDELDVPMEKIYGVATFYSQFNLYPKGQYKISVCLGTACYVKGSGDIYNKLMDILGIAGGQCTADGKFSLDACRCIGACGPVSYTHLLVVPRVMLQRTRFFRLSLMVSVWDLDLLLV